MGGSLTLDAAEWAAVIVSADGVEQLGAAGSLDEIPAAQRRRLPAFTRNVLRCALPLLRAYPGRPLVYGSEHGDLDSTVGLLTDLARGELLSPTLFAGSVHNAPAGALGLSAANAGDHTAVAGTDTSFSAALTEAYARLVEGADTVLIVQAEARLPEVYRGFDSNAPDAFLAIAARLTSAGEPNSVDVTPGRAGVGATARALAAGGRTLRFSPPVVERAA